MGWGGVGTSELRVGDRKGAPMRVPGGGMVGTNTCVTERGFTAADMGCCSAGCCGGVDASAGAAGAVTVPAPAETAPCTDLFLPSLPSPAEIYSSSMCRIRIFSMFVQ